MYPSKGGGGYGGQQPFASQQAYGQLSGPGYSGNPGTGTDMGTQHALASRQADVAGFRTQGAQYGGPYASVYGSVGSGQQVGGASNKGAVTPSLQGRTAYPSSLADTSKYSAGTLGSGFTDDYLSASNRGYGAYVGRDLQSDPARRFADSSSLTHQHQTDMHDHMDQASLLRQQQMMKAQSDIRQAEYLSARAAPISAYGGRMDVDAHGIPILGGSQYGAQHSTSILGAPRRNVDDLIYAQGSSNAGYGVSLPPGRDYLSGKGLHGPAGSDYQVGIASRDHLNLGSATIAERKDDRDAFRRELDLRDEERRRDLIREREKERERERERERDREHERDRLLERRDRERERDQRHGLDSRRGRTPTRASKDRRGSSAIRDDRPRRASPRRTPSRRSSPRRISPRRVSPRREPAHRRRSPIKEKKRDYVCKVHPFCLVEAERNYLSLNKRYPKLSIAPEFTKAVFKWPNGNLHLSLHTPVSFEHDFIEDNRSEETGLVSVGGSPKNTNVVWNAKVILMSGVSSNALDDLCSDKNSDDRLIHFNNILRFVILKKERSFIAIGGQWQGTMDGDDPSIDYSSLDQTARRCVKDITQLDLQNCKHWNPFLEIHYNRIGADGLSSYKEITVLYVPDLSDCLPALDSWRSEWIAHKKDIAEREKQLASKKEKKSSEKDLAQGDHVPSKSKKPSTPAKPSKVDEQLSKNEKVAKIDEIKESGDSKDGSDQKGKLPEPFVNSSEKLDDAMIVDDIIDDKKGTENLISTDLKVDVKKPAKKKIIRKVVKGKAADKKETAASDETVAKIDDKMEGKSTANKQIVQQNSVKINDSTAEPEKGKTFIRRKVVKKAAVGKSSVEEDNNSEEKIKRSEEAAKNNNVTPTVDASPQISGPPTVDVSPQISGPPTVDTGPQTTGPKTAGKKKIIRRIVKKKVPTPDEKVEIAIAKDGVQAEIKETAQKTIKVEDQPIVKEEQDLIESIPTENKIKEENKVATEKEGATEKKTNEAKDDKKSTRADDKVSKVEKRGSANNEPETPKHKNSEKDSRTTKAEGSRQEKEKRSKEAKSDSKQKPKEAKEKGKSDEPPKHPGFFVRTKRNKGSKVRSTSLSLGGLLEYNEKDVEESTFELSLFAESFNEMLQYQMGCRILLFLEKLRKRFVIKHKQRKRQREEKIEKEKEAKEAEAKRQKINDSSHAEKEPLKAEAQSAKDQNHEESNSKNEEADGADKSDTEKKSDDESEEEDLEDIYEEYDEMDDGSDAASEADEGATEEVHNAKAEAELTVKEGEKVMEGVPEKSSAQEMEKDEQAPNANKDEEKKTSANKTQLADEFVDKELLQAFRFFDYNKVGYIKMDDLRCLLHILGKFHSHRDVKELVQSALYESSSARDDRIFYKKLAQIKDL